MSLIDESGLGARTRETAAPAAAGKRGAKANGGRAWRLPSGGALWTALVAGAGGSAAMIVASLGSATPEKEDPKVTVTIADPACAAALETCYQVSGIAAFAEQLRRAMAEQAANAATAEPAAATAADRSVRTIEMPLASGLEEEIGATGEQR